MQFQVFIPAHDADEFDLSLRVEARNWMQALKLGLQRTYSDEGPVRNVFCDIKSDDLIHVTDLVSHRVFRIRRLPDESQPDEAAPTAPPTSHGQPTLLDATASAPSRFRHPKEFPAVDARSQEPPPSPLEVPTLPTGELLGFRDPTGRFRPIARRAFDSTVGPSDAASDTGAARVVEESVSPTTERLPAATRIGRDLEAEAEVERTSVAENTLERVFLEISDLFEPGQSVESAVAFALDLAMRSVPAESGSVLFADASGATLYFADARGPKADELLAADYHVPLDQGLVGFCARAGVSLALSDADQDPRFYRDISEELGYPVRSVLCAPIECEGRAFGALELLNHRAGAMFASTQLNVVTYIAGQLGRFLAKQVG